MKKVATFVRVSEFDTAPIAVYNQKKKLEDYCESQGYEVIDHADVIGDRSATMPMLKKLFESSKEKGFDTIVMQSINRVVGSVDEAADIAKAFNEFGVKLETVDGSHKALENPCVFTVCLDESSEENDEGEGIIPSM